MYNEQELNRHKKSDSLKWILAFSLIAVLLVGMVASLILAVNNGKDKPADNPAVEESVNDFVTSIRDTQRVKLSMSKTVTVAADNSVSKTITATVLPATATNKAVDWSVMWADSSNTENVSDYITVTPASNGSTTATVTCYKAFAGDILVVATTREGNYTADCVVSFVGVPTALTVSTTEATENNGAYGLGVGVTYHFNINQSNVFNTIGEPYQEVSVSVVATGDLTVGTYESDPRGSKVWYTTEQKKLSDFANDIISYSLDGQTLSVTINKSIEGYYSSMVRNGSVKTYYNKVKSVDSDCYFTFYVNNKKIGASLQNSFKVAVDPTVVTGVNVNSAEMEF